jgi:hypothetical protein
VEEGAEHGGHHGRLGGDLPRHHGMHDLLHAGARAVVVTDRERVGVGCAAREKSTPYDQWHKPRGALAGRHG